MNGSTFAESILFFVAVTVLHEAIHYGDFNYNNDYWDVNINGEEGWLFEEEVYGGEVRISSNGGIEIIPLNN
jgi:hypothetical protein